jgi:hypothetical protein
MTEQAVLERNLSLLAAVILKAAGEVVKLPSLAHHLSKASVERWFAFELAAALDPLLLPSGEVVLVERGGTSGKHGNIGSFDLLVLPVTGAVGGARLEVGRQSWGRPLALELKAAHLADGIRAGHAYPNALVADLTKKSLDAAALGRPCDIVGVLVTTDGTWGSSPQGDAARKIGDQLDKGELALAPGLRRLPDGPPRVRAELSYPAEPASGGPQWRGRVWAEVIRGRELGAPGDPP